MLKLLRKGKLASNGTVQSIHSIVKHSLISIEGQFSSREQSHGYASTSDAPVADGPMGHSQVKAKLYDRGKGLHANSGKPRLMGGDPLLKIRMAQKLARGIPDDKGYEQDNTPKKMRKEKPPRGHPDRKPRHLMNPRRIPDMFRVTNWRRLVDLMDLHHDYLDWKKLMGFIGRTTTFYRVLPNSQKDQLRKSGLMERLRNRAEELDIRQADKLFIHKFNHACTFVGWDAGEATNQRLKARLAQLEEFDRETEEMTRKLIEQRMRNEQKREVPMRMETSRRPFKLRSSLDDDIW